MLKVDNKIDITRPCLLIATGSTERLEVLRSPVVLDTKRMYQPVRQFIAEHGLVLAVRETFEDQDWMYGVVEVSVYVPPAMRNDVLTSTAAGSSPLDAE